MHRHINDLNRKIAGYEDCLHCVIEICENGYRLYDCDQVTINKLLNTSAHLKLDQTKMQLL
ncbi:hypothetical protein pb186bvf_006339 [Paramecium bursaria]